MEAKVWSASAYAGFTLVVRNCTGKTQCHTLTTPADVYLRMLTCQCMLMFTMVKADHALVLQGQNAGVCVLMH